MSHYWPTGTVYGTLLNFHRERDVFAEQMTQLPYKAPPAAPVLYVKTANTFSADGAQVAIPAKTRQIEVGATIGMIIGDKVPVNAQQFDILTVANVVLMNDFSIPHASYFRPPVKFKCPDGLLGIGPQTVAVTQIGDLQNVQLEVRINGEWQQTVDFSNTIRSAAQLLQDVSEFMTLRAGDVLMLGLDCLPGGGRPLASAGDRVEISSPSMPALGRLSNTLIAQAV